MELRGAVPQLLHVGKPVIVVNFMQNMRSKEESNCAVFQECGSAAEAFIQACVCVSSQVCPIALGINN